MGVAFLSKAKTKNYCSEIFLAERFVLSGIICNFVALVLAKPLKTMLKSCEAFFVYTLLNMANLITPSDTETLPVKNGSVWSGEGEVL